MHKLVDQQKEMITEKYAELNKKLKSQDKQDHSAFKDLHEQKKDDMHAMFVEFDNKVADLNKQYQHF